MAIRRDLVVSINNFLKGPNLRSYMDKRLISGLKQYFTDIANQSTNVKVINTGKSSIDKFISAVGQSTINSILSKYSKCTGSDTQMKFISGVVAVVVLSHLKVHELSIYLNYNRKEDIGLSDTFIMKLQSSVDLANDLEANFDDYLSKEPSKGDLRYIDVGLKRLLATEVDSIV